MIWHKKSKGGLVASLGLVGLLLVLVWQVRAQSGSGSNWEPPYNLSQSGTAVNPVMVVDPSESMHLFWVDKFVGYVYARQRNGVWSEPSPALVPFSDPPFSETDGVESFTGYLPTLVADDDRLYAFWVDEDATLHFSRSRIPTAVDAANWLLAISLSDSVTGFDTVVDSNGRLHLTYIKRAASNDAPTGVYYRSSDDLGDTWTEPVQLFQSNYLRSISQEESNVQIAVSANNQVYVVWDNPLVEMVYLARSHNRGDDWGEAELIDKRQLDDALESPGPGKITVLARDGEVHLAWQGGHTPRTCSIYHMVSQDDGDSWSDVMTVLDINSTECPDSIRLFWGHNDLLFLMTEVLLASVDRTQVFLQAWDGEAWSEPELQDSIFDFEDPDVYRAVAFSCIQEFATGENQLFLITCGATRNIEDVWVWQRPLGDREDWSLRFAPPPAWSAPEQIVKSTAVQDSLAVFATEDGLTHAFWTVEDQDTLQQTIQYSLFDGTEWSRPLSVVESLQGNIQQASFVLHKQFQRFMATWVDAESRSLYFSQVQIPSAAITLDWQDPIQVHDIQESSEWPQIAVDETGAVYIVFSIPVNEQRGVYLVKSTDRGNTWSEPIKVLDGTALGWELVGKPRMILGRDGRIYLAVIRHRSFLPQGDTELYFFSSTDGGATWSDITEPVDSEIAWHDLALTDQGVVHLVWAKFSDNRTVLWHSYSENGGQDWTAPLPVANFTGESGAPALALDPLDRLHLLYLDNLNLGHWVWDGLRWSENDSLDVSDLLPGGAFSQAATVNQAQLHVLFNGVLAEQTVELETGSSPAVATIAASQINADARFGVLHTAQTLDLPGELPTPLPTWTPTPLPQSGVGETAVSTITPTPSPTPYVDALANASGGSFLFSSSIGALILSIGLVVVLVLSVFVISILRMRKKRS